MSPITAAHSQCHGHPSLRPFSLYPLPSVTFIQSCCEALNQGPGSRLGTKPRRAEVPTSSSSWADARLALAPDEFAHCPHLYPPTSSSSYILRVWKHCSHPQPLGLSGRQLLEAQPPSFPTAPPLSGKHEPPKSLPPNFSPIRVGGYIRPGPPDPGCYSHSSFSQSPGELCLSHPGQLRVWH